MMSTEVIKETARRQILWIAGFRSNKLLKNSRPEVLRPLFSSGLHLKGDDEGPLDHYQIGAEMGDRATNSEKE
jgi:hypothetical protein